MPPIDYMKVLDIAAITMGISSHIEVKALDLKLFSAALTRDDGTTFEILMRLNDFDLELNLDKNVIGRKEFEKWLAKFEFELEQIFFKNISMERSETKKEYRVILKF